MSKTAYSVADGHVLRGAEKVAVYTDGVLEFLPDKDNYRAPVVRFLRESGLPADVAPMALPENPEVEEAIPEPVDEPEAPTPTPEPAKPVIVAHAPSVRDLKAMPKVQVDPIKLKTYPGAPAMDPAMGDKTPAFVRWLRENHPDDAAKRYANRIVNA